MAQPTAEYTATAAVCDVAAAFGSAFCVAPFIAMVDQAIVQNASGTASLRTSMEKSMRMLLTTPRQFLGRPAFLMLWGVYGGTYVAVNTITSVSDAKKATTQQRAKAKFAVVSAVNLSLNISKDKIFARMFGQGMPRAVPLRTIGCFALRDSMTVFATFNLAPMLGESGLVDPTAAALVCPIAMQWLSAPTHLLGLDLYNRPAQAFGARAAFIQSEYLVTALARTARIFPAFSICPQLNNPLRRHLRDLAGCEV